MQIIFHKIEKLYWFCSTAHVGHIAQTQIVNHNTMDFSTSIFSKFAKKVATFLHGVSLSHPKMANEIIL